MKVGLAVGRPRTPGKEMIAYAGGGDVKNDTD